MDRKYLQAIIYMIGFDKIFSYWVFAWYLLYMLNIVQISPKLPLLIGLIENIMLFFAIMPYIPIRITMYFCITVIIFKIIPILTLWNTPIGVHDWKYLLALFVVYIGWIYATGYLTVYSRIFTSFTTNDTKQLPGVMMISQLLDKSGIC